MRPVSGEQLAAGSRPEQRIDVVIDELSGIEKDVTGMLRHATEALVDLQEENRRLRREVLTKEVRWYTEQQLAERIGISKDTLARLRRLKKIPCVKFTPSVIRYSSIQEAAIAELLEQWGTEKGQGVRGRSFPRAATG